MKRLTFMQRLVAGLIGLPIIGIKNPLPGSIDDTDDVQPPETHALDRKGCWCGSPIDDTGWCADNSLFGSQGLRSKDALECEDGS